MKTLKVSFVLLAIATAWGAFSGVLALPAFFAVMFIFTVVGYIIAPENAALGLSAFWIIILILIVLYACSWTTKLLLQ